MTRAVRRAEQRLSARKRGAVALIVRRRTTVRCKSKLNTQRMGTLWCRCVNDGLNEAAGKVLSHPLSPSHNQSLYLRSLLLHYYVLSIAHYFNSRLCDLFISLSLSLSLCVSIFPLFFFSIFCSIPCSPVSSIFPDQFWQIQCRPISIAHHRRLPRRIYDNKRTECTGTRREMVRQFMGLQRLLQRKPLH